MLKNLLLICAVVGVFSLTSCSKEYTCTCVQEVAGFDPITTTATLEGKKSDVKTACENGSSSTEFGGVTTTITCTLD